MIKLDKMMIMGVTVSRNTKPVTIPQEKGTVNVAMLASCFGLPKTDANLKTRGPFLNVLRKAGFTVEDTGKGTAITGEGRTTNVVISLQFTPKFLYDLLDTLGYPRSMLIKFQRDNEKRDDKTAIANGERQVSDNLVSMVTRAPSLQPIIQQKIWNCGELEVQMALVARKDLIPTIADAALEEGEPAVVASLAANTQDMALLERIVQAYATRNVSILAVVSARTDIY